MESLTQLGALVTPRLLLTTLQESLSGSRVWITMSGAGYSFCAAFKHPLKDRPGEGSTSVAVDVPWDTLCTIPDIAKRLRDRFAERVKVTA